MLYLERTRQLYRDYLADVARTRGKRDRQSMGGMFGFLQPSQDPCHERFVDDMEALMAEAAQEELTSEDARELMEFVFREAEEYQGDKVLYWMLLAAHALTMPLVERLTSGDAAALRAWYEKTYTRTNRLPNQKVLIQRLREREGA